MVTCRMMTIAGRTCFPATISIRKSGDLAIPVIALTASTCRLG